MKFFRINVSGTKFFLSDKNILSDSPNIFTERFSNELQGNHSTGEFKNMRMAVDRNPETFALIHRYLQGYDIISREMSKTDMMHLVADAKFYHLQNLQRVLENSVTLQEYIPLVNYCSSNEDASIDSMDLDKDVVSTYNLNSFDMYTPYTPMDIDLTNIDHYLLLDDFPSYKKYV